MLALNQRIISEIIGGNGMAQHNGGFVGLQSEPSWVHMQARVRMLVSAVLLRNKISMFLVKGKIIGVKR